jgi:uracil-DNA glycosylase
MEMELWQHFATSPAYANVDAPMPSPSTPSTHASAPALEDIPPEAYANDAPPIESAPTPSSRAVPPRAPIAKPNVTKANVEAPLAVIDPTRIARIASLDAEALASDVAACQACGLCKQRKEVVVGVGAANAPWMFIGEGPGAEEDETGEPFVGQAGKLLDAMLTASGLQRSREVYIANVVKCRPPGNRTPTTEEAAACAPYLDRQIALIKPSLIVALGKTAVTRLTGSEASMSSLRGSLLSYRNIPVVPTYHPSYLLRTPTEKLKAWEDLQFAKSTFAALKRA